MVERREFKLNLDMDELGEIISYLKELNLEREEQRDKAAAEEGVGALESIAAADVVSEKIADVIATLQEKLEGGGGCLVTTLSFSDIDYGTMYKQLNIKTSAHVYLVRQGNHKDRAAESIARGGEAYMTSQDMYRHLNMLANLVSGSPEANRATSHLWIETILFRVSAMLSGSKRIVLNIKQDIPEINISPDQLHSLNIDGQVDYHALATTNPSQHTVSLYCPGFSNFSYIKEQNISGLFITEAKQEDLPLVQHIPQAVTEMYAAARYLMKRIFRGALTNGHKWIFLILHLNEDGIGARYTKSHEINIQTSDHYPHCILPPEPDIIAGILSYWMEHSFVDLDENDWFTYQP